jgi:MFS family permease
MLRKASRGGRDSPVSGPATTARARSFVEGPAGRATVALIALRVLYAYNWMDVGAALPQIQQTFHVGAAEWGVLLAVFLAGAGILQVPAGFLSRRYGSRAVSLWGIALLGGAAAATALAPTFAVLVALRGLAGAGAGLFFSPAIGLVSTLQPSGRRGVAIGTFSSAFSGGAGLGIFATAILAPAVGWEVALGIGGVALLVTLGVATPQIPARVGAAEPLPTRARRSPPSVLALLSIWGIGLAFIGLEGASFSTGQYYVPYAESIRGFSSSVAGAVSTLFILPSVLGGPVGGFLAERFTNRRSQLVTATIIGGGLVVLVPFAGLLVTALAAAAFSFLYGYVYAVMYVLPAYLPGLPANEIPLGIGLFNAIQLAGGGAVTLLFGVLVAGFSYAVAWTSLGVLTFAPLAFLAWVPAGARRSSLEGAAAGRPAPDPPRAEEPGPP